ncbi:uncharacterized protein LOC112349054 [Selaginella moellendorffii]|uniref:uncharacterized protein LOC112349054 n=1 Tax=Selaginella moellendorffii TaxID=88036 RepID=UPI000D1CBA89|nr:uncharacterized protein LOC112349054 [Selaginella moellendorffii]|eukprot:XP_024538463.1 uncharacterized protein LOC112349054 [Selaginella moellendorffii]
MAGKGRRDRNGRRKRSEELGRVAAKYSAVAALLALLTLIVTPATGRELQDDDPLRKEFSQWKLLEDNENVVKEEVEDKLADLDRILQSSAFASFGHPVVTGQIYDVSVRNSSLSSRVMVRTVRLKMGSLVHRGFTLEEFSIPTRAGPFGVARIVLVYRRFIGKLYEPRDLIIVSPVLGIKVYDAVNLSATNAPELDFVSRGLDNVTVRIPVSRTDVTGVPQCATFDALGNVSVSSVTSSSSPGASSYVCSSRNLGDFALVVPLGSIAPASGPAAAPLPLAASPPPPGRSRRRSRKWRVILGAVLGSVAGLVLLGLIAVAATRYRRKSKLSKMEQHSDRGEMLQTSLIGGSRAPIAGASRTRPVLESDYAASS